MSHASPNTRRADPIGVRVSCAIGDSNNSTGRTVGARYISAQGEWMTRQFVPYTGTVEFDVTGHEQRGTLVLKRDNPTDRPEQDRSVRIPIRFE